MKKIYFLFLYCMSLQLMAQKPADYIRRGNVAYKNSNMAEAVKSYDSAVNSSYKYIALMNKGNALYRQQKHEDAIHTYEQAASADNKDRMLRSGAYYNAGVVYSNQKKTEESIEAYKNALRLNWKDQDARENLQKALLERKSGGGGGGGAEQQQSSANTLKAQKELEKLENKEKSTQQKVSKQKSKYEGSAGKDW